MLYIVVVEMYIPELIRKEALRRGLSPRTIQTYNYCVKRFFKQCRKDPKKISKKDIRKFLDKLVEKGASGSTINIYLNSLKFFYTQILNRNLMIKIRFSKTPKKMPTVLTKEETKSIIEAVENPKHRLIVKLLYSAGLRVSELVRLKPEHFEFDCNYGWVRQGKGKKDRLFIIAETLKEDIIEYISKENIPRNSWLFTGYNEKNISIKSVQQIIKKSTKIAGIRKNISPHTLRHSFATHLIENGYDVAPVQSLLGHKSSETTMVYLHMASPSTINVKSPFDSL